jgi:hypothetical protein
MNNYLELADERGAEFLPLGQYNDLIRRSTRSMSGERRLLWAVLEDAIRAYLWSVKQSTRSQRLMFRELSDWFNPRMRGGLFSFNTICELLELDSTRIANRLGSVRVRDLPLRRQHRVATCTRLRRAA